MIGPDEGANFHPHLHGLVSKGAFDAHGLFYPLPWIDTISSALAYGGLNNILGEGFFSLLVTGIDLYLIMDIGNHTVSRFPIDLGERPSTYKGIAKTLGDYGIAPKGFADGSLYDMAEYRHRLVHFYYEISPRELFQKLYKKIEDSQNRWNKERNKRARSGKKSKTCPHRAFNYIKDMLHFTNI